MLTFRSNKKRSNKHLNVKNFIVVGKNSPVNNNDNDIIGYLITVLAINIFIFPGKTKKIVVESFKVFPIENDIFARYTLPNK